MDSWAFDEKHYFYIMCFLFFVSLPLFASEMVLSCQGPVYTKRQRQRCDNSAMMLQNGFATHFQASPLISMRTESLMSSQSGRSVDQFTPYICVCICISGACKIPVYFRTGRQQVRKLPLVDSGSILENVNAQV